MREAKAESVKKRMPGVSISNLAWRNSVPCFAYSHIAKTVLPRFDISLVFVTPLKARALNKQMRGKNYVPNVLSYALDSRAGEIIICLSEARKQAPTYNMSERVFVLYLFIHGLLHIKGWVHSVRMERSERNLLARFAKVTVRTNLLNETTHSHRNRHRHIPGKNGRDRGAH